MKEQEIVRMFWTTPGGEYAPCTALKRHKSECQPTRMHTLSWRTPSPRRKSGSCIARKDELLTLHIIDITWETPPMRTFYTPSLHRITNVHSCTASSHCTLRQAPLLLPRCYSPATTPRLLARATPLGGYSTAPWQSHRTTSNALLTLTILCITQCRHHNIAMTLAQSSIKEHGHNNSTYIYIYTHTRTYLFSARK